MSTSHAGDTSPGNGSQPPRHNGQDGPPSSSAPAPRRPGGWVGAFLFPLALFQHSLFVWGPYPGVQLVLPFYLAAVLMWGVLGHKAKQPWRFGWAVCLFIVALCSTQIAAISSTIFSFAMDAPELVATSAVLALVVQILAILLMAAGIRFICTLDGGARWIIRGAAVTTIVMLTGCVLQLLRHATGMAFLSRVSRFLPDSWALHDLPLFIVRTRIVLEKVLDPLSEWVSPGFGPDPSSALFTIGTLAMCSFPLLLGFAHLVEKSEKKAKKRLIIAGLLAILFVFAMAGTWLVLALAVSWMLMRRFFPAGSWNIRQWSAIAGVCCLLVTAVVGLFIFDEPSRVRVTEFLEPANATQPVRVLAREYWGMMLEAPQTGVGFGLSAHLAFYADEFGLAVSRTGNLGPGLLLAFAEFGVPIVLLAFFCMLALCRRLIGRAAVAASPEARWAGAACTPFLTVTFTLLCLNMGGVWEWYVFWCMLLFLWALSQQGGNNTSSAKAGDQLSKQPGHAPQGTADRPFTPVAP